MALDSGREHRVRFERRMRRTLAEGDREERRDVVEEAGRLGAFARPVLPLLASALADEDGDVREKAQVGLAWAGPDAIPQAIAMLAHEDPLAVEGALRVLFHFGPASAPAVERMQALLRHETGEVRAVAAAALGAVGEDAEGAVPALQVAARDPESAVAESAREALRAIRGEG